MEDYYPNEIEIIIQEYAELSKSEDKDEQVVAADDF